MEKAKLDPGASLELLLACFCWEKVVDKYDLIYGGS